ncbi:MAG: alpha/beta hydrolase [Cyclobacteriaceae bacterium]
MTHQSKIRGWIEIDGGHSWSRANMLSRDIMMDVTHEKIQEGTEEQFWNFALDWYEEHPVVGINEDAHYTFVAHANGYDYNPQSDSLKIPFTDLLFHSPISTAYFFAPYNFQFLDQGLDLTDQLHQITVPTSLCWGRHDKVFPAVLAEQTYQKLGTATQDKFLRFFEYSAHSPNYEEPNAFATTVINFIQQYE